jgi:hypothetical protein
MNVAFGIFAGAENLKAIAPAALRRNSAKMLRSELRVLKKRTRKSGRIGIGPSFLSIPVDITLRSLKVVTKLSQTFLWRSGD